MHSDRHAGGRNAKSLWEEGRRRAEPFSNDDTTISTVCDCCDTYAKWKVRHNALAQKLMIMAARPFYYVVNPEECTMVDVEGTEVLYNSSS